MEVSESKWVSRAIDNVDRYLNRGGDLKGDKPQLLGGTNLLNTIGVALGLPVSDPEDWTRSKMKKALKGKLVYFEGDAREAIDVVAEQIRSVCDGDDENYVTVLPIELYKDGILTELPLFRVQRYKGSKKYYVDNIGRYYDSFLDWFDNNKLPPCKMAYPYKLRLTLKPGYDYSRVLVADTPRARDGSQIASGVDTVFQVAGVTAGIGLLFVPGAAPLVIAGTASTLWGTGRSVYNLHDRATHGQSLNPITDVESRLLWLSVAESVFSIGAHKATQRMLSHGRNATTSSRRFVDFMNTTGIVVGGINKLEVTRYMIEHYDEMTAYGILMHLISLAFWTKNVYTYKTADTLIELAENEQL